ncbi:MAG: ArsA-related P-loop ATPase [Bacteriovorax sp.]|nr:ArsA-related P-loop ATPase [Bacteriovorax sp.]
MPSVHHRLYIITGKGGVGKTTISMAFTKYLQQQGINAKYNCFHQTPEIELIKKLNLPTIQISIESSAETYIGRKLNSTTIASWIMKTHFFKSLFQMIPGLGHMILLGHLISELEEDPSLVIVLDSPASGHALTMFESTSNFKKIFSSGLVVKDIDKMQTFLKGPNNLKTHVITLATELSLTEALDLKNELDNNLPDTEAHCDLVVNNSFQKFFEYNKVDFKLLPPFLTQKVALEENIVKKHFTLPYIDQDNIVKIVTDLSLLMEGLV